MKGNEQIFSRKFPVPLIAHLQYQNGSNHFVVISKINEKRIWTYDPALGKVSYKKEDFLKVWSGYLIIVSPTPNFVVQKDAHALFKFVPLITPHVKLLGYMIVISLVLSLFGILSGFYFRFFVDKRNKNKIGLVPGMTATARIKVRTEPLYVYLLKQIGL